MCQLEGILFAEKKARPCKGKKGEKPENRALKQQVFSVIDEE